MNLKYSNAVSCTWTASATDNMEKRSSTTGRKLNSNARKNGLGGTVTLVLLTLNLLATAAGVSLDGLVNTVTHALSAGLGGTVTHARQVGFHQIATPVDSDSAPRVTVPNVS